MGLFSSKLSTKQMAHLCYRLSALTNGGIPIVRAFQHIAEEPHCKALRPIFVPMVDTLRAGGTLGEALRGQSRYLPDLFIETMIAGEIAGRLDTVLSDLNRHYERMLYLQRLYVRGAMYPLLLLLTFAVIIPYVQGLVLSSDSAEVYTLTFLWAMLRSYGPPFLIILVLARLGLLRKITDPIFSRIWPIAGFWHRFALARFCRCMGIMLGAGLTVRQSIERAAAVTTHPKLKKALCVAVPLVQQGTTLEQALRATDVLPELVQEMVRIGEITGCDEELFYKSAEYLYNEAVYPVHTIGIGLTAYLILAWFVLFVAMHLLGWVLALLVQSLGAVWSGLFAG